MITHICKRHNFPVKRQSWIIVFKIKSISHSSGIWSMKQNMHLFRQERYSSINPCPNSIPSCSSASFQSQAPTVLRPVSQSKYDFFVFHVKLIIKNIFNLLTVDERSLSPGSMPNSSAILPGMIDLTIIYMFFLSFVIPLFAVHSITYYNTFKPLRKDCTSPIQHTYKRSGAWISGWKMMILVL